MKHARRTVLRQQGFICRLLGRNSATTIKIHQLETNKQKTPKLVNSGDGITAVMHHFNWFSATSMNCTTVMSSSSHLLSAKDQCVTMYICNVYTVFKHIPIQQQGSLLKAREQYEFELRSKCFPEETTQTKKKTKTTEDNLLVFKLGETWNMLSKSKLS